MSTVISQLQTNVTSATPGHAEFRKAKWLDDKSRENLELVERGWRDARAKNQSRYDELNDLRHKRDNDRVRLASWDRDRANGIKFSEADVAARDALAESVQAQDDQIKKRSAITPDAVLDPSDIESELGSLPTNTRLRPKTVTVVLKKGQDDYGAFQEAQRENAALKEKRVKALGAALTITEAIEASDAYVDRRAERGKPKIGGCYRFSPTLSGRMKQGEPVFPHTNVVGDEFSKQAQNGIDFFCWMYPEEVKERLAAEIKARKYPNMLSRQARAALMAEIDAKLLENERLEVELCRRLMLAGDSRVAFRPGLSALAVLAVEIVEEDDGEETSEKDDFEFEDAAAED